MNAPTSVGVSSAGRHAAPRARDARPRAPRETLDLGIDLARVDQVMGDVERRRRDQIRSPDRDTTRRECHAA
jgi:hypothetical protein